MALTIAVPTTTTTARQSNRRPEVRPWADAAALAREGDNHRLAASPALGAGEGVCEDAALQTRAELFLYVAGQAAGVALARFVEECLRELLHDLVGRRLLLLAAGPA